MMDFERYRSFHTQTEPQLYKIVETGNLTSDTLLQYTVDDIIFVLILESSSNEIKGEDIKKDLAVSNYVLRVFTKKKANFIYRIKSMKYRAPDFCDDVSSLVYYQDHNATGKQTPFRVFNKNMDYQYSVILGGYFKYPRPKDMRFSIDIVLEVECEEKLTTHSFTFNYSLTMKDHWIRLKS
ncbi:hypothetical protein K7J14_02720 [Treponema zuelzerae]|uniref:Uncharacterized protein n=1 Tax=Teretinema zuelzerae TaxID=156 RepID=A0AAE3EFS1_9SPIR|nr:hypothetical protein [Teretinema zuelzerae]MCD1653611.1 hypothetical protein [Teretinema zuelzerae]